jgi:hypothetical protein
MNGIKFQQMGGAMGITGGVVHVNNFNAGAIPKGAKHKAANAPKAVNCDFHGCYGETKAA